MNDSFFPFIVCCSPPVARIIQIFLLNVKNLLAAWNTGQTFNLTSIVVVNVAWTTALKLLTSEMYVRIMLYLLSVKRFVTDWRMKDLVNKYLYTL